MRSVAILMLVFVTRAYASCDSDPDGTNEQVFFQSCKSGETIVVNSVALFHDDGSNNYPIDVTHPVTLRLNMTNTGKTPLDKITISASVARYTDIFGICSWIGIPTFDLLDNLDGCNYGSTNICPMPPGVTVVNDRIDPASVQAIINILSTSEPYRITLSFKSGGAEVTCVTAEGKISK
uniref:MD-2-related lipid-recognition domain-containing protein n=1 Tax=Plectus sambesii TaxID=2011161 RepID=A0A914WWZ6_9BILA